MKRTITKLSKVIGAIALLSTTLFLNTLQAYEPEIKAVRFVYFVEKDQTYSQADFDAIKQQAFALQQYWNDQFGGTFYLTKQVVDVVMGDHDAEWYVGDKERWTRFHRIAVEVGHKIENSAWIRIIIFPKSIRNGHVGGNTAGAVMDGDDISCITGRDGKFTTETYTGSNANCLAHVAHEFGHTYRQDNIHVGEKYDDCMRYGIYTLDKMCDFGQENRLRILDKNVNTGWLDASPLETVDGYKNYAYTPTTVVKMENPKANKSTLTETTETFSWTQYGSNIEKYRFKVGSKKGGSNYYNSPVLGADSRTVTVANLPEDGSNVYVRIRYSIEGKWYRQDYQYKAVNNTTATIVSPVAGETLSGNTETFTFENNGATVSKYKVFVGSKKGGSDYYKSPRLSADTQSVTVANLPTDGTKVYVKFVVVDEEGNRKISHFVYVASK